MSITSILRKAGQVLLLAGITVPGSLLLQSGTTEIAQLGSFPLVVPTYRFGIEQERYATIEEQEIPRGATLSQLLELWNDNPEIVANVLSTALRHVESGRVVAGRPVTIFIRKGELSPEIVVYQPNDYEQVIFDFARGETRLRAENVSTELVIGQGIIESSLWNAVVDKGYSPQVAVNVQRAIESAISLRALDKGDEFSIVYERKLVGGVEMGAGNVKAVHLRHRDRDVVAIHFENEEENIRGFYSPEGESLKRGFLLSPVKGARISSAYNLRRRHPILGYVKPHLGTDYAARHGSPIMAVADGVVVEVSRSRGNGNYVKIKHDDTYSTQYLHMSKHARGLRKGQHVTQGQTIGYVGSTGLATGPHVCFRFWKNNKQVNHLKIDLPAGKPLPEHLVSEFEAARDALLQQLNFDYEAYKLREIARNKKPSDKA